MKGGPWQNKLIDTVDPAGRGRIAARSITFVVNDRPPSLLVDEHVAKLRPRVVSMQVYSKWRVKRDHVRSMAWIRGIISRNIITHSEPCFVLDDGSTVSFHLTSAMGTRALANKTYNSTFDALDLPMKQSEAQHAFGICCTYLGVRLSTAVYIVPEPATVPLNAFAKLLTCCAAGDCFLSNVTLLDVRVMCSTCGCKNAACLEPHEAAIFCAELIALSLADWTPFPTPLINPTVLMPYDLYLNLLPLASASTRRVTTKELHDSNPKARAAPPPPSSSSNPIPQTPSIEHESSTDDYDDDFSTARPAWGGSGAAIK